MLKYSCGNEVQPGDLVEVVNNETCSSISVGQQQIVTRPARSCPDSMVEIEGRIGGFYAGRFKLISRAPAPPIGSVWLNKAGWQVSRVTGHADGGSVFYQMVNSTANLHATREQWVGFLNDGLRCIHTPPEPPPVLRKDEVDRRVELECNGRKVLVFFAPLVGKWMACQMPQGHNIFGGSSDTLEEAVDVATTWLQARPH